MLLELDAQGQVTHRYLWGPAVDQILADEQVFPLPVGESRGEGLAKAQGASAGTGQGEGLNITTAGTVLWPLTDHLGTVRDLARYDSASSRTTIVNHLTYDAFGQITGQSDPAATTLVAFTGRPLDPATGLQNHLHRWYDSRIGRWLSEDPLGFRAAEANLYRYCFNTPTAYFDPTGMNRWLITNGFHWWLVVEEWDATGTKVIGYRKLEYWVYGYELHWGARPGNPNKGDVIDRGGWVVGEWKSNAMQDQALLNEWRKRSEDRNRRWPIVYYLGYFIGLNCESIALLWVDYGGAAGPAVLIIPQRPVTPQCPAHPARPPELPPMSGLGWGGPVGP